MTDEVSSEELDLDSMPRDEEDKVIVKLSKPIQFGSEVISEFRIREPMAKDLRKLKGDPNLGDLLDLAAKLSAQPSSVIDMLKMKDMQSVVSVVGSFIAAGR